MKIFQAKPIESQKDHPSWENAGYILKPFYIRAMDEENARGMMVNKFPLITSVSKKPVDFIVTNPWGNWDLSSFKELSENEIDDLGVTLDWPEKILSYFP